MFHTIFSKLKNKKILVLFIVSILSILVLCGGVMGVIAGFMYAPQNNLEEGNNIDNRIFMTPTSYKANIYKKGDKSFAYRLREPIENKSEKAPLIIYLHGNGSQGDDNRMQMDSAFYKAADKFAPDSYVFMPQCGIGGRWDDYTFDDNTKIINNCIDDYIIKNYPIDIERIYVTGVSMGGFGVSHQIETYANRYAAAMIVCGGADSVEYENWINLPVWIAHGDADTIVSVESARTLKAALDKIGNTVYKYTEYPGMGHGIAKVFYSDKDVWEWMLGQKLY